MRGLLLAVLLAGSDYGGVLGPDESRDPSVSGVGHAVSDLCVSDDEMLSLGAVACASGDFWLIHNSTPEAQLELWTTSGDGAGTDTLVWAIKLGWTGLSLVGTGTQDETIGFGSGYVGSGFGWQGNTVAAAETPTPLRLFGANAYPTSSTTGSDAIVAGGWGAKRIAVTQANCDAADTLTVTCDGTQTIGTVGTTFTCLTSDEACATTLAVWLESLTGVGACANTACTGFTGTSGTAFFYRDINDPGARTCDITANNPTGTCFTNTEGTSGDVLVGSGETTTSGLVVRTLAGSTAVVMLTTAKTAGAILNSAGWGLTSTAATLNRPIWSMAGLFVDASDPVCWGTGTGEGVATNGNCIQTTGTTGALNFNAGTSDATLGKGQSTNITVNTKSVTFAGGGGDASKTTTGTLIPAGAFIFGITSRVTTTATGCTSVDIGTSGDTDAFANDTAITANTTTTMTNGTVQLSAANVALNPALAATEVVVTANGGNCVSGVWAITAHYMLPVAQTSN